MDCSPPGSSVHGILQAGILDWVAMPSSRGSSWPNNRTHVSHVSCIGRWVPYHQHHLGSPGFDLKSHFYSSGSQAESLSLIAYFPLVAIKSTDTSLYLEKYPGDGEGQGSLACCSPWGHKELVTNERLNKNSTYAMTKKLKQVLTWMLCLWLSFSHMKDRAIQNMELRPYHCLLSQERWKVSLKTL